MREIKYRGWNRDSELMFNVGAMTFNDENLGIVVDNEDWILEGGTTNDVILMQYTGLKDKNCKEIYEGDLLRNGGDLAPCEVKFENGVFVVGDYGCELWKYSGDTKEIIGNIYENKN